MLFSKISAPYEIDFFHTVIPTPGKGEVLIKMKHAGICASDVQVYHGKHKYVTYPLIQGHEGIGIVEAVGMGVINLKVGDHVVMQPQFSCGTCFACKKHRINVCENLRHLGISREGLFSEYAVLPEWNAVKVDINDCTGALVEPLAIAVNAVRQSGIQSGDRAVVLGAGAIGNLIAQVLVLYGAEVLLTDIKDEKLAIAKAQGIPYTVNTRRTSLSEAILDVYGSRGVHAIFECAATETTFNQALDNASKASAIVIVGNFKEPFELEIPRIQRKEIALVSVMGTDRESFLEAASIVSKGQLKTDGLISKRFPFIHLKEAYEYIDAHPNTMKVLLDF